MLPHEVDEAGAQARYQNGVLLLDLPKKEGKGGNWRYSEPGRA